MKYNEELYEMKLWDFMQMSPFEVRRVPGGWLFCEGFDGQSYRTVTFVPFNNEFQELENVPF